MFGEYGIIRSVRIEGGQPHIKWIKIIFDCNFFSSALISCYRFAIQRVVEWLEERKREIEQEVLIIPYQRKIMKEWKE